MLFYSVDKNDYYQTSKSINRLNRLILFSSSSANRRNTAPLPATSSIMRTQSTMKKRHKLRSAARNRKASRNQKANPHQPFYLVGLMMSQIHLNFTQVNIGRRIMVSAHFDVSWFAAFDFFKIGNATFGRLPDEMILAVLTYLNKASIVAFGRTCHRYRAVAWVESICFPTETIMFCLSTLDITQLYGAVSIYPTNVLIVNNWEVCYNVTPSHWKCIRQRYARSLTVVWRLNTPIVTGHWCSSCLGWWLHFDRLWAFNVRTVG